MNFVCVLFSPKKAFTCNLISGPVFCHLGGSVNLNSVNSRQHLESMLPTENFQCLIKARIKAKCIVWLSSSSMQIKPIGQIKSWIIFDWNDTHYLSLHEFGYWIKKNRVVRGQAIAYLPTLTQLLSFYGSYYKLTKDYL